MISAGEIAAIIAVLLLPPKFSLSSHVNTESLYGIKSAFFDFLVFVACKIRRQSIVVIITITKLDI